MSTTVTQWIKTSIWSVLLIGRRAACYRVTLLQDKVYSRLSDAVMKVRDKLVFATRHGPKLEKDAIPCIVIHKNNLQYLRPEQQFRFLGKWTGQIRKRRTAPICMLPHLKYLEMGGVFLVL